MKQYVWAQGRRATGDPMLIGRELDKLQRLNRGVLKPDAVVDAAKDEKSALHAAFEWDDEKAGHAYRVSQARQVIASIRVITSHDAAPKRVFINLVDPMDVGDQAAQGYLTVAHVLSRPELLARAKDRFLRDLQAFERRYQEFDELTAPLAYVREQIEALPMTQATV